MNIFERNEYQNDEFWCLIENFLGPIPSSALATNDTPLNRPLRALLHVLTTSCVPKRRKRFFFSRPQQWVFDLHDDAVRLFIFKQSSLSLVIWLGEIQFSCVGPDFFTSWLGCWWVPTVPEMNAKQFYKWGGLLMRYFLRASGVTNLRSGFAFYDDLERLSCCSGESFF